MTYPRASLRLVIIGLTDDIAAIQAALAWPLSTSPLVYAASDPAPRSPVARWSAGPFTDDQFNEIKSTLQGTLPGSHFQVYTAASGGKTLDATDPYFLGDAPASSPFTTGGYLASQGLTTNPN